MVMQNVIGCVIGNALVVKDILCIIVVEVQLCLFIDSPINYSLAELKICLYPILLRGLHVCVCTCGGGGDLNV